MCVCVCACVVVCVGLLHSPVCMHTRVFSCRLCFTAAVLSHRITTLYPEVGSGRARVRGFAAASVRSGGEGAIPRGSSFGNTAEQAAGHRTDRATSPLDKPLDATRLGANPMHACIVHRAGQAIATVASAASDSSTTTPNLRACLCRLDPCSQRGQRIHPGLPSPSAARARFSTASAASRCCAAAK